MTSSRQKLRIIVPSCRPTAARTLSTEWPHRLPGGGCRGKTRGMDPELSVSVPSAGGVFTRAQALAAGYDDNDLRAMLRNGQLTRIRRGAYVDTATYTAADQIEKHRLLAHAVRLAMGDNVAVSHGSAAVLHGFAEWGIDLSRLNVTRLDDGASRVERDVHHHVGAIGAPEVVEMDGLLLVTPARSVVETVGILPLQAGVVIADSALRSGRVAHDELHALAEYRCAWPGSRGAREAIRLADGRSESVGESRTRLLLAEAGLPVPELQRELFDEAGRFIARVDFFFPEYGTVVEFDGKVKYGGYGNDALDVVLQEKAREDRIRELGLLVVRLVWADLDRPEETAQRIRAAFRRAGRIANPDRWLRAVR